MCVYVCLLCSGRWMFSRGVLKYAVCLCGDVVFSVCIVKYGAVGARVWKV